MTTKRENYLKRVAEFYNVTTDEASNIVRVYSAINKLSETIEDVDSLVEIMLERISMNEPVVPRKEKEK